MDGTPQFLDSRLRGNDGDVDAARQFLDSRPRQRPGELAHRGNGGKVDSAEAVYEFVRTIPPGRVVTYGQVAGMIEGVSLTPRQVGGAMRNAPPDVPWQRVVGAGGRLPIGKKSPEMMLWQRRLLREEGVEFGEDNCILMANHNWPMCDEEDLHGLFETPQPPEEGTCFESTPQPPEGGVCVNFPPRIPDLERRSGG